MYILNYADHAIHSQKYNLLFKVTATYLDCEKPHTSKTTGKSHVRKQNFQSKISLKQTAPFYSSL